MTAALSVKRGLVDLGVEADRSWSIIWETFGKLRHSNAELTQGSAARLAMARRQRHLERTHWKLLGNYIGHYVDEPRGRFTRNFRETWAAMERGLASRGQTGQNLMGTDVHT